MDIQFLWKDEGSNVGNCSSLSKASNNGRAGYVVNGEPLDEATRRTIPHAAAAGEGAVWVPANVIDRIKGNG
jgi:hypothetical protein